LTLLLNTSAQRLPSNTFSVPHHASRVTCVPRHALRKPL
jgi:hypothetical protein